MHRMRKCFSLFAAFFKIGLFTFGGGYAMLSMILSELCERRGWISEAELMDVAAVAESTPGPIAINSATYIGYKQAGFFGALAATLGVVLPSFGIIYLISLGIEQFMEIRAVQSAFKGVQVAVAILILRASVKLIAKLPGNFAARAALIVSTALALLISFDVLPISTLWLILGGAVFGLAAMGGKGEKEDA